MSLYNVVVEKSTLRLEAEDLVEQQHQAMILERRIKDRYRSAGSVN